MATNDILPFASTDSGTNLLTQAEYAADAQRLVGNQPGVARSKLVNKVLRQASLIAAGIGKFLADNQAINITDGLDVQNIADYLLGAIRSSSKGIQAFTSSGTFVVPAGITTVYLTGCGAGGGAAAYGSAGNGGGGGGGGGSVSKRAVTVTPGASITVTIGTGGVGGVAAGNNGTTGGTTSFGALLTMTGGTGGLSISSGGTGGSVTGGTGGLSPGGQAGEQYNRSTGVASGGNGGGCLFGSGGFGGCSASTPNFGSGFGSGGGGGGATGGAGGRDGFLIVEW